MLKCSIFGGYNYLFSKMIALKIFWTEFVNFLNCDYLKTQKKRTLQTVSFDMKINNILSE